MHLRRLQEKNIQLAKNALKAGEEIIFCATAVVLSHKNQAKIKIRVRTMRRSVLTVEQSIQDLYRVPDVCQDLFLTEIKQDVKRTKRYKSGNCAEYASLVLNYMRKQEVLFAELYHIVEGDHAFVVLDREQGSDANAPCSWGSAATVIDAWANKAGLAASYTFLDYYWDQKNECNAVCPLDPTIQHLAPYFAIGVNAERKADSESVKQKLKFILASMEEAGVKRTLAATAISKLIQAVLAHLHSKENWPLSLAEERYFSRLTRHSIKEVRKLLLPNPIKYHEFNQSLIVIWMSYYYPFGGDWLKNKSKWRSLFFMVKNYPYEVLEICLRFVPPSGRESILIDNDQKLIHFFIRFRDDRFLRLIVNHVSNRALSRLEKKHLLYAGDGCFHILHYFALRHRELDFLIWLKKLNAKTIHAIVGMALIKDVIINLDESCLLALKAKMSVEDISEHFYQTGILDLLVKKNYAQSFELLWDAMPANLKESYLPAASDQARLRFDTGATLDILRHHAEKAMDVLHNNTAETLYHLRRAIHADTDCLRRCLQSSSSHLFFSKKNAWQRRESIADIRFSM